MRITLAWLLGLSLSFGAARVSEGQLSPTGTGGVWIAGRAAIAPPALGAGGGMGGRAGARAAA